VLGVKIEPLTAIMLPLSAATVLVPRSRSRENVVFG
jgi:hypothetical protein